MEYEIDIKKQRDLIRKILLDTQTEGMEALCDWLDKTDYYTAPASTRFHGARAGGLALHSLCVYYLLQEKSYLVPDLEDKSIAITALLHDLCKVGVYQKSYRNVKKYCDEGSKRDAGGNYEWVSEQSFTFEDAMPLGHAPKSIFIIGQFIRLNRMETAMILHHMGAFPGGDSARDFSAAARAWPAVALMHAADMEATHCIEDRNTAWLTEKTGLITLP